MEKVRHFGWLHFFRFGLFEKNRSEIATKKSSKAAENYRGKLAKNGKRDENRPKWAVYEQNKKYKWVKFRFKQY